MIELKFVPTGLEQLKEYYGVPGRIEGKLVREDSGWKRYNLQQFQFPVPLRRSWDKKLVLWFWAHTKVGEAIVDAILEIKEFYGLAFMRRHDLDLWGGCYEPRLKRGSDQMSVHSWGVAVDWCPELGGPGEPTRLPWSIVEAFLKRGFENFPRTDGMHFQAAKGY